MCIFKKKKVKEPYLSVAFAFFTNSTIRVVYKEVDRKYVLEVENTITGEISCKEFLLRKDAMKCFSAMAQSFVLWCEE